MFDNLYNTSIEFWRRRKAMTSSAIIDLVFFFTYGLISSHIVDKIREYAITAATIAQKGQVQADAMGKGIFSSLANLAGFNSAFNSMLAWIAFLVISTYLLYSILQAFSFWIIAKNDVKKNTKSFFYRFMLVNLGWVSAYYLVDFINNVRKFALLEQNLADSGSLGFMAIVFIILYLASISYSIIAIYITQKTKKRFMTFRLAFRLNVVKSAIEIMALFLIANIIISVLNVISRYAAFAFGIPAVLLLLSFSKLHMFLTIKKESI